MTNHSGRGKKDGHGIVPETLSEDNYEQWKRCLKHYLVGHGLWGVVSGKDVEPSKIEKMEHEEWKRKNALALHAIQMSCGTGVYAKFNRAHVSAHYAWSHLAEKATGHLPPSQIHDEDEVHHEEIGTKEYLKYDDLYLATEEGDWEAMQDFLLRNPNAIRARVTSHNDTALHVAILAGQIEIAEKLVSEMDKLDLEMTNEYGATCLSLAAICGARKLAEAIVNKNWSLVKMENEHEDGHLPVIVAALYGQKDMVRYLYRTTPSYVLSPENGANGAMLLNCLVTDEIYDVAVMLVKLYPKLGVTPDQSGNYALRILANKTSAFPSGTKFAFWENWIYYFVRVHSPLDSKQGSFTEEYLGAQTSSSDHKIEIHGSSEGDIVRNTDGSRKTTSQFLRLFHNLGWGILRFFEIKHIHDRKLVHHQAIKLMSCMFREMRELSKSELEKMDIDTIIYEAIKHGVIEFIHEILKYRPEIMWKKDRKGRTIFAHAIVLRQEKIFSLIYGLGTQKRIMARRHDVFRNNYLHLAAKLSPPSQLKRVSGAALQMQRELHWFKEVEALVQPKLKEEVNENNKNPETLFTHEHKKLAKDAETWMKNTAGSSMIVGTLIAAVMFTTAFTVPGGNNSNTGLPIMLDSQPHAFLIFTVSNALSMFTSCTSLLMFLGILTAKYAEQDFLKSLPMKLIFGLACLFLSIVTMMLSFGASLYLILHGSLSWVTIPIVVISVIPVALYAICQFPLLIEMTYCTYGSGIFDKRKKKGLTA